jgi:hypothetical protein
MQYEELMAPKEGQGTPQPTEGEADTSFSLSNFVSHMFGLGKGTPQETPQKQVEEEKVTGKPRMPSPLKLAAF